MAIETTGTVNFRVGDETYQTWYKIVGDLSSSTSNGPPLVILHGGPGMSHHYMSSHAAIHAAHGVPVVFYDQLGAGASTHLPHKPREFWTVELFMDELDNLLRALGIVGTGAEEGKGKGEGKGEGKGAKQGTFDLLGHSWGGMLAADYAATRRPTGLRRLVIANAPASNALWASSMRAHLSRFPQPFQDLIHRHEREGTTSAKEYRDALQVFYEKHTCQVVPWPEEFVKSFKAMEEEPSVSEAMLGIAEFTSTGTLKTWSVIDRLHQIARPTLVVNGTEEGAMDKAVAPFVERIPRVKWVKFARSHCPFWEDETYYFETIRNFLMD